MFRLSFDVIIKTKMNFLEETGRKDLHARIPYRMSMQQQVLLTQDRLLPCPFLGSVELFRRMHSHKYPSLRTHSRQGQQAAAGRVG